MQNDLTDTKETTVQTPYKALVLDLDHYQAMLDHPKINDTRRREIIEALWKIICCFVEIGYQVQPAESCGQNPEIPALREIPAKDSVYSTDNPAILATINNPAARIADAAANKEES